ncbi:MAG: M23 family metallopeptidase [Rhodobacteraceae bacterium]|nr:M23 family metallopeptidase [Paracoccaceae bacterium]
MRAVLTATMLTLAGSVSASDFFLTRPIDCQLGTDCHIQQFVDHDPGPGARDHTCGPLSYDTHKGTDFALPTLAAMAAGVDVLAAAPGTVRATRDGVRDRLMTPENAADVEGRECGNGLVIDHSDGWQTQYCHLARGSLRVRSGDVVARGAVLGRVGLSGRTQFPHLHLTVRRDGAVVDPFALTGAPDCAPRGDLWQPDLDYVGGGIVAAGFDIAVPEYDAIKAGTAGRLAMPADAPALVLFGLGFGARQGDVVQLAIGGPAGQVINERVLIRKNQAQFFRAAGKRTSAPWPRGTYNGSVTLIREGRIIGARSGTLRVE